MKLNTMTLSSYLLGLVYASPTALSYKNTTMTSTTPTTSTPSPPPATPESCSSIPAILLGPGEPITYTQYFSGRGVTLNPQNPGNDYNEPITLSYAGSRCEAAIHCANVGATANYYSFDLHYLEDRQEWQCVLYFEGNGDAGYFDVEDGNVCEVYGYST